MKATKASRVHQGKVWGVGGVGFDRLVLQA